MAATTPKTTNRREGESGAKEPDRRHNDHQRRPPALGRHGPHHAGKGDEPGSTIAYPRQIRSRGKRIRWRVDHHCGAAPSKRKDHEQPDPPAGTPRMDGVEPDLAGRCRPQLPPATTVAMERSDEPLHPSEDAPPPPTPRPPDFRPVPQAAARGWESGGLSCWRRRGGSARAARGGDAGAPRVMRQDMF